MYRRLPFFSFFDFHLLVGSFEINSKTTVSRATSNQNNHFPCSTRINYVLRNDLRPSEGYPHRKQPAVDSSNINHSNGLRFKCIDRHVGVNERQQSLAGQQRIVNGHPVHQSVFKGSSNFANGQLAFVNGHVPSNTNYSHANGHEIRIKGHSNSVNQHSSDHNVAKVNSRALCSNGYRNIISGCQDGLFINKMVMGDDLIKPSRLSSGVKKSQNGRVKEIEPTKENDNLKKHRQVGVDSKKGIDRLINCQNAINGRLGVRKELGKDTFGIPVNLRQILKPTVVQKRQEILKVDYDPEDINGPYNFRQLLRPAEYLPTESLRKRKGGLACNGVPASKDKVPEKHVKRRAPLAPNQNKFVNMKK